MLRWINQAPGLALPPSVRPLLHFDTDAPDFYRLGNFGGNVGLWYPLQEPRADLADQRLLFLMRKAVTGRKR